MLTDDDTVYSDGADWFRTSAADGDGQDVFNPCARESLKGTGATRVVRGDFESAQQRGRGARGQRRLPGRGRRRLPRRGRRHRGVRRRHRLARTLLAAAPGDGGVPRAEAAAGDGRGRHRADRGRDLRAGAEGDSTRPATWPTSWRPAWSGSATGSRC
ncbi:hypothetical protein G5V59_23285 [Nocardioides sp. W3-2-3]|nr:hypothetical protein [Nocardioides convexus]